MRKPVIGVLGSARDADSVFPQQVAEESNLRAIAEVTGALPVVIAASPAITDIAALLDIVDGILLSGARSNVHPRWFGAEPDGMFEPYDEPRDALAISLIEACVQLSVPLLGICRGMQEMNVAFGGTLHADISTLPGRLDHRTARLPGGQVHADPDVVFAARHRVDFIPDGTFARLLGTTSIRVNSLHRQCILVPGKRIVLEGKAEDGTIEAISIADAPALAIGVQWHAEWDAQRNPVSRALLQALADAAKA